MADGQTFRCAIDESALPLPMLQLRMLADDADADRFHRLAARVFNDMAHQPIARAAAPVLWQHGQPVQISAALISRMCMSCPR